MTLITHRHDVKRGKMAFWLISCRQFDDFGVGYQLCFDSTGLNVYIYRGYSNVLLNMAFISSSEVENIYIS